MERINYLVGLLVAHDVDAWTADGKIFALDEYYIGGVRRHDTIELPASLSAIRDFLGY